MKKYLIIVSVLIAIGMQAQPISEQQARDRAVKFLNTNPKARGHRAAVKNRELKAAEVEAQSLYAFNFEDGGYIIASGDSRALPVLGYSMTGNIDWEQMPDNMRAWLKQYDEAIATLGNSTDFADGNAKNSPATRMEKPPVEPLIKTHWNQKAPYWDQAPLYKGVRPGLYEQRCVTGCVATAMAQVMNYYEWPKTVPEGVPAYDINEQLSDGSDHMWHVDALPPVTFDWDNMLDDYQVQNPQTGQSEDVGNDAERRAVATLMRYCGQAVKMKYAPDGSSSDYFDEFEALVNRFGYAAAVFLDNRSVFTIDEWEDIIYGELDAGRPVLYGGSSNSEGHAFVCDGYDGSGLFHINWGWGSMCDGYFSLSVLNPFSDLSISIDIGYSIYQNAIIYLDPAMQPQAAPRGTRSMLHMDRSIDVLERDTARFDFSYFGDDAETVSADYAFGTIGADGQLEPRFMGDPNDSIIYSTNYLMVKIDSAAFQPGDSLTLHPMLRFRKPAAEWQVVPPLTSYIVAGRTDDGRFFITTHGEPYWLEITGCAITKGTGLVGERCDLTVYINAENDLVGELYLCPHYYGPAREDNTIEDFWGDWMVCGAYVRAGQQGEVTFSFVPQETGRIEFQPYISGQFLSTFELELNDTLANYDRYIENNSYFDREGDQWVYNVELCDKAGVYIPHYVPSDSIGLHVRCYIGDDPVNVIKIRDDIREYLKALPEQGGRGDYKFTYRMPIDISRDGEYDIDSYIGEWINGIRTDYSCLHQYQFQINNPITSVKAVDANAESGICYDLMGRRLDGIPKKKGLYIKGNKKYFVK